jgi:hypothetical protein
MAGVSCLQERRPRTCLSLATRSAQLELGQALEMGQGFEVQVRLRMYGVQVVGQIQQFADAIEGGACAFGAEFLGLARLRDRAAGDDGAQHIGLGEIGNHGIP